MPMKTLAAIVAVAGSLSSHGQVVAPASPAVPPGASSAEEAGAPLAAPASARPDTRSRNPFVGLFPWAAGVAHAGATVRHAQPRDLSLVPGTPAVSAAATVCGLTVWHMSPDFDPRIRLKSRSSEAQFAMRKIAPAACMPVGEIPPKE